MAVAIFRIDLGFDQRYILKSEGVIAVDAGAPGKGKRFARGLERFSIPPKDVRLVAITHGHWDHIGSAKEIKGITGAKIAMHHGDASWLAQSLKPLSPGVTPWGKMFIGIHKLFLPLITVSPVEVDVVLRDEGFPPAFPSLPTTRTRFPRVGGCCWRTEHGPPTPLTASPSRPKSSGGPSRDRKGEWTWEWNMPSQRKTGARVTDWPPWPGNCAMTIGFGMPGRVGPFPWCSPILHSGTGGPLPVFANGSRRESSLLPWISTSSMILSSPSSRPSLPGRPRTWRSPPQRPWIANSSDFPFQWWKRSKPWETNGVFGDPSTEARTWTRWKRFYPGSVSIACEIIIGASARSMAEAASRVPPGTGDRRS